MAVAIPFRSFGFVLFSYWGLELSSYQSIHKVLLHSRSVHMSAVSYSQMRKTFLTN